MCGCGADATILPDLPPSTKLEPSMVESLDVGSHGSCIRRGSDSEFELAAINDLRKKRQAN